MATLDEQRGSRSVNGELVWQARDYAELDEGQAGRVDYPEGLRLTGVGPGTTLLDLGCGPGGFCRLAADAGATVTGFDASAAMLQVAHERVPTAQFDLGDMRRLPYAPESFDVVTFFNSLQFCAAPGAALEEARRVTRPGGTVFIALFGREQHVEVKAKWRALAALLPQTTQGVPDPMALSGDGVLDDVVRRSGLHVRDAGYLNGYFGYADEAMMLRAQRATPVVVLAERAVREAVVNDTILRAFAPYRTSSGGYRLEVEWRYIRADP